LRVLQGTGIVAGLLALLSAWPVAAQSRTHAVIVTGIGGEPRFQAVFHEWGATMVKAATRPRPGSDRRPVNEGRDREGAGGDRQDSRPRRRRLHPVHRTRQFREQRGQAESAGA
jgi:hypothetical protein